MCIIAYKPAGQKFPSKKIFKRMFNTNPDGAGFMYPDDKGQNVIIKKGFMTYQEFMTEYGKHKKNIDKPYIFHFRITTNGGTSKGMCHPYPLTKNIKQLTKTNTTTHIGIAHNGIISMTDYATKISDTAEYIRRYMTKLLKGGIDSDILDIIEESISGSRLAIMESSGDVHLLGKWEKSDGIYYSNSGYKDYQSLTSLKKSNTYDIYNYCDGECERCINHRACYGYDYGERIPDIYLSDYLGDLDFDCEV